MNTEATTVLDDLFGSEHAGRLHTQPDQFFVVHRGLDELPEELRPQLLLEPERLTSAYQGVVEVTNGRGGQYPVQGPDPRIYFETLGLAARFARLEDYLPATERWLRRFEEAAGLPQETTTLYSFINASEIGLNPHCDPREHLAIQLVGTKTFRMRANTRTRHPSMSHEANRTPTRSMLAQNPDGFHNWTSLPSDACEVHLRPGSVLYIPRGMYHETTGGADGISVTLVIQLNAPNVAEAVLAYLADYLTQDPGWRHPLIGAWSDNGGSGRKPLERALSQLGQLVSGLSSEHILRYQHGGAASNAIGWGEQLQRNPARSIEVEGGVEREDEDQGACIRVTVRGKGCEKAGITLDGDLAELMQWLADRETRFSLKDLYVAFPDWEEASIQQIVTYLVSREAILVLPLQPVQRRARRSAARARPLIGAYRDKRGIHARNHARGRSMLNAACR